MADSNPFDPLGLEKVIEGNPELAVVGTILYSAYIAILVGVLIYNGYKVYQDLEKRVKASHLRKLIELSPSYTIILFFTETSILFYLCSNIMMLPLYFVNRSGPCDVFETLAGSFYQLGKTVMYYVYLTRLYSIYKGSKYALQRHMIIFYCVILGVYNFAVISVMVGIWRTKPFLFSNGDPYPNYCEATLEPVTATMLTVEDLFVGCFLLHGFWKRLTGTYGLLNKGKFKDVSQDINVMRRIRYSAYKITILTTVSITSTLTLILLTTFTGITWICGFDTIINTFCMILMNPQYNDKTWYARCCYPCILCCDKSGYRRNADTESKMTENIQAGGHASLLLSGDTFDQLRLTGAQLKAEYSEMGNNVEMKQPEPEPDTEEQEEP